MRAKPSLFVCFVLLTAAPTWADSFSLRVGRHGLGGESRLWEENVATFDFVVEDFNGLFGGVEFAHELNEFVDLAFGIDGYRHTVASRYRDFVRDDGTEIEQDVRLTVIPITAGIRFLPAGKFHFLLPYVAGGFGLYPYEYREEGEFIDFETFEIFGDQFRDDGVGAGGYAAAGIELKIGNRAFLFGEYRQHFVSARHSGDFAGFGDFDLDASQIGFGFTMRF